MYIKSLKLVNYRNYKLLHIIFSKNFNIIFGDNAQGKTNILEAIFLCASGRSHRTSKDIELVKQENCGYFIKIELTRETADSSIEVCYKMEEKKKIKINDIPVKRISGLMGHLNAVMFSPEDIMIIKEGPSERRRFVDITISQLKPFYFYELQQYAKILEQRNTLLKEIQHKKSLMDTLEIWNNNLAYVGSRIIKSRSDFIDMLNRGVEVNHVKLTDGKEKLSLKYRPSIESSSLKSAADIETEFLRILDASVEKELIKGITLYGPHRDDYDFFINGMDLRQYGSQGQQRTAILSIKLSEIDIMKEHTGEYPVLLLDDVMSELDSKRQEYLFRNIENLQTFITCTDMEFFRERLNEKARFLYVNNGGVNNISLN